MNAKHSLLMAMAGAGCTAAALVVSPGTYSLLRRRAGLEPDGRHFELTDFPPPRDPFPDAPDPRASLRARLAADGGVAPARSQAHAAERAHAAETVGAAPDAGARTRAEVDDTRARARAKASSGFGPARSTAGAAAPAGGG